MPATLTRRYVYFIGIDISKDTLDFAVRHQKDLLFHREIPNQEEAILNLLVEIKALPKFKVAKCLFCFEQTGIYSNHLLKVLKSYKANMAHEHPANIRNSLGITRGKSDKIDAMRLAEYAYRNHPSLRLFEPQRNVIQQLQQLSALRNRLIDTQARLTTPLDEQEAFTRKEVARECRALSSATLKAIKDDLLAIDHRMLQLIKADERLNQLYKLIISVPHIGQVTAIQILITTNEYKDICTAKKFACYAGIAPFPNESGIITRRRRVSVLANRKMKTLLHICAISAIRRSGEHRSYYDRKVAEGKNKMLVLNAIRYKLISRIFSCLRENRPYVEQGV